MHRVSNYKTSTLQNYITSRFPSLVLEMKSIAVYIIGFASQKSYMPFGHGPQMPCA
jgi:hypothetical protein